MRSASSWQQDDVLGGRGGDGGEGNAVVGNGCRSGNLRENKDSEVTSTDHKSSKLRGSTSVRLFSQ